MPAPLPWTDARTNINNWHFARRIHALPASLAQAAAGAQARSRICEMRAARALLEHAGVAQSIWRPYRPRGARPRT
jgi:hypothetical protein